MWQRIQTVFLTAAIVVLLVSLIQPIWSIRTDSVETVLTPFYLMRDTSYQYFPFTLTAILMVASITLAVTSITRYKNRVLQIKLGALNSLVLVGVVGSSVYFATKMITEFQGGGYGLGMYLPLVAVMCNLAANFFIRKDERLVRSSERLR
ncbi:MAG: DUF4293 domain-containing protein [Cyclobacteriaceae bacterium]|jgi:hypothetical protein|nr:DUF4293 domain-containing protein [Cyclobacteriaceae bacterium]